jgi:farnesyl-diphosphate farnesyltransferase
MVASTLASSHLSPIDVRPAPDRTLREAERFCRRILPEVSRTFALSIRCLPGELGRAVLTGYLLCRIADTVEDDPAADVERKRQLFGAFRQAFEDGRAADRLPQTVADLAGAEHDMRLMRASDCVFQLYRSLPSPAQGHIREWVLEMVRGMQSFVERYPQGIRIQTVAEYREYCYYVAGTVGHLLTELWREFAPGIGRRTYSALRERCASFGEALQTINILKDIAWDAERENSIYIPSDTLSQHGSSHDTLLSPAHLAPNRAALAPFVELADAGLNNALEYVLLVPRRAFPVRVFCALPVLFAFATMRDLANSTAMLRAGGGVKITRREVRALMFVGPLAVASNHGFRRLVGRVRRAPFTLAAG